MKLFQKWQAGLKKTQEGIWGRISQALHSKPKLDEELLEELEEILIQSDIGAANALSLIGEMRGRLPADGDLEEASRRILMERIRQLVGEGETGGGMTVTADPHVILVVGVNGTGKTTSIGKLAYRFGRENRKVLLAAADTFRAAAVEQLGEWAVRAKADLIRQSMGADPASVAHDAVEAAMTRGFNVVLVDTAGRLHSKVNLMEELKKIHRVIGRRMPGAPHEVLLVLDATTGQNGLNQARVFQQAVGVTGIILAKLDGTARGGIVVSIRRELGIPVKWVGLGEGLEDLVPFDPGSYVESIFGNPG
ncbi:signal recognition particle-docking protein FtsY [bacterium]|nr:signal recognition particle-docking protein FtsY [bacterium]